MSQRKSDVSTRLEDEEKNSFIDGLSVISSPRKDSLRTYDLEDDFDEDTEILRNFGLDEAWSELINSPDSCKVILSENKQQEMGLEIGVNISFEFPWKQIKMKVLADFLFDEVENTERLKYAFQMMGPEEEILIGYVPQLSHESDTFLIFETHEAATRASTIIKQIETYERWWLGKSLLKRGRKWRTKGSEHEVDLGVPRRRQQTIDVEVQSVYPINTVLSFKARYFQYVRDGYVELVSGRKIFQNISRKRMDVGTQSAPAKVHLEQQTDPTFPANAWSQYLYEIDSEDEGLDESDNGADKEQKKPSSRGTSKNPSPAPRDTPIPVSPPAPKVSEHIKTLLSTLDFNQVDMYRNDYPDIAKYKIPKYKIPYMEEVFSFANISRSHDRYVCSMDWHPGKTGMLVASYTFSTKATTVESNDTSDHIKSTALESNPVLLWTFNDTLRNKLEFESTREITCLSFCPYDENILLGGTRNGQIMIWDLQNRLLKLPEGQILTNSENYSCEIVNALMSWVKPMNLKTLVRPAAVSALECSQIGSITAIKWLHRHHYITTSGKTKENPKELYKYFVTMSLDGTTAFWNLDFTEDQMLLVSQQDRTLPPQLFQEASHYKRLDRILKPCYFLVQPQPIISAEFDDAEFEYIAAAVASKGKPMGLTENIDVKVSLKERELFRKKFICGAMDGGLYSINWEGFDFVPGTDIAREHVQGMTEAFPQIHDGPVVSVVKNHFFSELFVSAGRYIFAIWREDYTAAPLLWRKRPADITNANWSTDRPAVLFLTRGDGIFEVWDFLTRTDEPCLIDPLGGGEITYMLEHRFAAPKKILGIADHNSAIRMFMLPDSFQTQLPNELELLKRYIEREIQKMVELSAWQKSWCEKNADIIQEREDFAENARKDFERLQKEAKEREDLRIRRENEEIKKAAQIEKKKLVYDLPERLEQKWNEMNHKRLVKVLIAKKLSDPVKLAKETALEKDRLAFIAEKKRAIKKRFNAINDEKAEIRARLLPVEKENESRVVRINRSAKAIVENADAYEKIAKNLTDMLENFKGEKKFDYGEFLEKGQQRRRIIQKLSTGISFQRQEVYQTMKKDGNLSKINFGFERFIENHQQQRHSFVNGVALEEEIVEK